MEYLTFDEWYAGKHGFSFDHAHKHPSGMISTYFEALSRELRNYHNEMFRRSIGLYVRQGQLPPVPDPASGHSHSPVHTTSEQPDSADPSPTQLASAAKAYNALPKVR